MKSQIVFLQMILRDVEIRCHTSTHLDLETIKTRFKHEGMSFLTISLPNFANDFQKALAEEKVSPGMFDGFAKHGKLPRFLGGLMERVFDRGSGQLLETVSIDAIRSIRQVTMAFGKIELECSSERIQASYDAYLECELDIRAGDRARKSHDLMDYRRVAHLLWRSLNSRLDRRIYDGELTPAHGPGASADRLIGNQKFTLKEWTLRMEEVFPYLEWASPSYTRFDWVQDHVDFREPGREWPAKVIDVPKTLKAPRIIA